MSLLLSIQGQLGVEVTFRTVAWSRMDAGDSKPDI